MIVGIGIDVASIERMARALSRHGSRFAQKILTLREIAEVGEGRATTAVEVARRFAVKEAFSKALGAPRDVFWHDLEVFRGKMGKPKLELRDSAEAHARRLSVTNMLVSITEQRGVAAAVVILESA